MTIKLDVPESQETAQKPIDENIRAHTSQSGHLQLDVAAINAAVMAWDGPEYCEVRPGIRKSELALRNKLEQMSLGKNPTADLSGSPSQSIGYRQKSRDNLIQAAKVLGKNL